MLIITDILCVKRGGAERERERERGREGESNNNSNTNCNEDEEGVLYLFEMSPCLAV